MNMTGAVMSKDIFVVVDGDSCSRNSVYRLLSARGYAFPVESPSEVEPYWPANAWVVVRDDPALLDRVTAHMRTAGVYHPIMAYGQTTLGRICSLFNQGLVGYVSWPDSDGTFLQQIDRCMQDAAPRVNQLRISSRAMHRIRSLSTRESQVIARMSEGRSNKEIAKLLDISPRTVEIHRANALVKLGVDNSIAAAVQFQLAQLAQPGREADEWAVPDLPLTATAPVAQQALSA